MRILVDEQGNTVAYLYKRAIIDKTLSKVMGIVLGNCLFAKSEQPVGRLFHGTLRDEEGNIIAKLGPGFQADERLNTTCIRNGTWEIMMEIKDHVCNHLPDKKVWSQENLESFFVRRSKMHLAV